MPFGIGPLELVVVLVIVLVIFGPKRLPGLGRSLGQGMREFKSSIGGGSEDEPRREGAIEGDARSEPRPEHPIDAEAQPGPAKHEPDKPAPVDGGEHKPPS